MRHESPNKRFTGYIVLPDFWNIQQLRAFESALPKTRNDSPPDDTKRIIWKGENIEQRLPALIACVSEWHIAGVPEKPTLETFPVTPIADAGALVDWIFELLQDIWLGETVVPNE